MPAQTPARSGAYVVYFSRGTEFRINSQTAANQVESSVTALTTGGFVVVWKDEDASGDGNLSSIKGQRYDALGAPAGGEFLVNTQTVGNQLVPKVAGLSGGRFAVTWTDASGVSDGSFSSVQAQIFDATGNKIGAEFLVNTHAFSTQSAADITGLTGGGFVITWSDLTSPGGRAQVYDASGAKVGGELAVNASTWLSGGAGVAGSNNGGFVTVWRDDNGTSGNDADDRAKAQIFDATGAKVGAELLVTAKLGVQTGDVALLSDGRFVVSWVEPGSTSAIMAQMFDAAGSKSGSEFLIKSTTTSSSGSGSLSALNGGGFVVAWTDLANIVDGDVRAQVFDSTGTKFGSEVLVTPAAAAFQNSAVVAGLANGSYVVTWSDFGATLGSSGFIADIKAQMYDTSATGTPGSTPATPPGSTPPTTIPNIPATPTPSIPTGAPLIPHVQGTGGDDSMQASAGTAYVDGLSGIDTITFSFKLTEATVTYAGNTIVVDGPSSRTTLTGFEKYVFADGMVDNNDGSPLVDDLFYYSRYHDVWNAHVDADAHYNANGWHENRDPNAFFDTSIYLSSNADVRTSGANPLSHYSETGWKNGRLLSFNFDGEAYLAANPDVKAAGVDPLAHFLANGAAEGRVPFAPTEFFAPNGFDYVYYLKTYADIAAAHVDPFQHFQQNGWKEGRSPNALFDTQGYLATYTDVKAAGVNPLDHYHANGWKEGRDPSVNFDSSAYLAAYADVKAAGVDPLLHYLDHGRHEGRSAFADGVFG